MYKWRFGQRTSAKVFQGIVKIVSFGRSGLAATFSQTKTRPILIVKYCCQTKQTTTLKFKRLNIQQQTLQLPPLVVGRRQQRKLVKKKYFCQSQIQDVVPPRTYHARGRCQCSRYLAKGQRCSQGTHKLCHPSTFHQERKKEGCSLPLEGMVVMCWLVRVLHLILITYQCCISPSTFLNEL